jgi:hypothetical protein
MINNHAGPEKLSYEQRKISEGRYESIPRRRSDMQLFASLTSKQLSAYDLIEEGHNYEMSGLPAARMRYSDAPGGFDYELTPRQMQVVFDYREWRSKVFRDMPACHYAVISYMKRSGLRQIENSLRIGHGKAIRYISIGLNEYCKMKNWGDQEKSLNLRRVKPSGYGPEISAFQADYRDETGRPVKIFSDIACEVGQEQA